MSRRAGRRPLKRNPNESMMEFFLRDRANADASIDRDVERSCTSKQQYASEAQARAIATMQGMSGILFTYQCRYCEFWHLTRRPTSGTPPGLLDD